MSTFCFSQVESVDNTVNDFDRRYRSQLNSSDSVLIDEFVMNIQRFGCQSEHANINHDLYSSNFLKSLYNNIAKNAHCFETIINHLDVVKLKEEYIRPQESMTHPIFEIVCEDAILNKKIQAYFFDSDYLENCNRLIELNPIKRKMIIRILKECQIGEVKAVEMRAKIMSIRNDCKRANLILLMNM